MDKPAEQPPIEFDKLKGLVLDIARQRCPEAVLKAIVQRLASLSNVALARIWLIEPGDRCGKSCETGALCTDVGTCLHLVASATEPESPLTPSDSADSRQRVPLRVGTIGRIAASGDAVEIDLPDRALFDELQLNEAPTAELTGFLGQPMVHSGEVLGVLAVLLHQAPRPVGILWLRMVADMGAAAIANARAFEEIQRLKERLEQQRDYLCEEVSEAYFFGDIVGQSPALARLMQQIELVAPTDANVLILGESGTGKELVAREIHKQSQRRGQPMIKVNCASIPRELYESEFFGHVRGAFTGALKDRTGRFELADRSTLFLDEVGEIPLELQGKLLRVLQEGEFERVGEERTRKVNVRILAATNRDLKAEVEAGRFRQDLYYRLNVFPIEVAPLRRRKEDIPLLALRFAEHAALRVNRPLPRITQANIFQLQAYEWPGNVRELQNVIERAVITSHDGLLRFDLPSETSVAGPATLPGNSSDKWENDMEVVPEVEMQRRQRENILAALKKANGKIYGPGGAASLLGIRPTTLASRMKKMKITASDKFQEK